MVMHDETLKNSNDITGIMQNGIPSLLKNLR